MEQLEQKTLSSEAEVKAWLHPVRMELVNLLQRDELTLTDLANRMEVSPGSLSHHMKLLIETGILALSRKEKVGRQTLKYYRPTAKIFNVDSSHDEVDPCAKVLLLLEEDMRIARAHMETDENPFVFGLLKNCRIPASKLPEFAQQITNLIEQFSQSHDATEESAYSLGACLYRNPRDYGAIGHISLTKKEKTK